MPARPITTVDTDTVSDRLESWWESDKLTTQWIKLLLILKALFYEELDLTFRK